MSTRRKRILVVISLPIVLGCLFLLVDIFLHTLTHEPWPDMPSLIMSVLVWAATTMILAVYQYTESERVAAREILASREASYRMLFDLFPESATVWSRDGMLLMQNLASARFMGGQREAFLGKHIADIFGPDATTPFLERLQRAFDTGAREEQDDEAVLGNGRRHVFRTCMQRIRQPDGTEAVQVISYDITERAEAEQRTAAALRASETLRIQEHSALAERQRLARELHDSVSQALYGIALGVNTARNMLDRDKEATRHALNYSITLARAGLSEMRALIFELRPESLRSEGLVAALRKQAEAVNARFEIPVNIAIDDEPDLPLSVKEAFYRIAQEALHNAVKHAQARELWVRLTHDDVCWTLSVADNGVGFDPATVGPGHLGLKSMQERAVSAGGHLMVDSAPGAGTRIQATVPRTPTWS